MSEKKIGRWFVHNLNNGHLKPCGSYAEASEWGKNHDGDLYRVIYMQEIEPPKLEEECPELEPGDICDQDMMCCVYMVIGKNGSWQYDGIRIASGEANQVLYPAMGECSIDTNDCNWIYRHGRKIWWKGKMRGDL